MLGALQEPQPGDLMLLQVGRQRVPSISLLNSNQIKTPKANPSRISSHISERLNHLRRQNSSSSSQIKSLPAHAWDLSLKESHTRLKSDLALTPEPFTLL